MNTNYLLESGVNLDEALKMLGDMETYDETIPNFKNALVKNINNMHYFLSNEDAESYAISAHSVKSDSKFFGFMHLASLALDHETKAKEKDIEYLKAHFNEITNEINKTINIVNTYLGGTSSNKPKVLIADDSDVVIALAKKILDNDYDITAVQDGEDVIKELELGHTYDAMLLDINMPIMNGLEVLAISSYMLPSPLPKARLANGIIPFLTGSVIICFRILEV